MGSKPKQVSEEESRKRVIAAGLAWLGVADAMASVSEDYPITHNERISHLLAEHFKAEPWKGCLWLLTANPYLGGIEPARLMMTGREAKVLALVQNAAEGELP